jgi:hypothetical protein
VGTANGTDRLHDALGALDAARTVGNPAVALCALDSLDAESAVLRGIVTAELDTADCEPLDGVCGPISDGTGPIKIAHPAMGSAARITDLRTRGAH